MRTLKNVAGGWKNCLAEDEERQNSDRKQQSFELKGWLASRVESRVRWSPHLQETREFDPNKPVVTANVQPSESSVRPQGLKRQAESTTEDLEDASDQGDADDEDLCSEVLRELYVEPPPETNEPPDVVRRLQRAMYVPRDAAAACEREGTRTLLGSSLV